VANNIHKIIPVILTYNEEANIQRTLSKLTWAHKVLVIDSGSSDKTIMMTKNFPNTEVIHRPFDSFQNQWTFGLSQIPEDRWMLRLDADYVLSDSLIDEVNTLDLCPGLCYSTHFQYWVLGSPIRCGIYPCKVVLFQKNNVNIHQDGHTERVFPKNGMTLLSSPIYHDDRKSKKRWIAQQDKYALDEAQKYWRSHTSLVYMASYRVFRLIALPVYILFFKCGFLDGINGLRYLRERLYSEINIIISAHRNRPTKPQKNED
jgi:glycosyltransferase involved in cell wall biosynthesis